MAMNRYGADGSNLNINGIAFEEFGDTDPAITIADVDPRSVLKRGVGGTSVRLDNQARPKRVTVHLMPGSDEVRQILALEKTGVDFAGSFRQTGTAETFVFFDGVLEQREQAGRAGKANVSDDTFVFLFNDSEET